MNKRKVNVLTEIGGEASTDVRGEVWGTTDEIALDTMTVDGKAVPALTFGAFGYYTGGSVSLPDLIKHVAKHHPELLREALASTASA